MRYRFCKENPPRNDPESRIGVFSTFLSGKKKVEFFWGYRKHIINDAVSELPLVEITLPANVRGTSVVVPQFIFIKEQLGLKPKAVIGDSEYDSATIIKYIVKEFCAKSRIAKNVWVGQVFFFNFLLPVPLSVSLGLKYSPGEPFEIRKNT